MESDKFIVQYLWQNEQNNWQIQKKIKWNQTRFEFIKKETKL